MKKLPFFIWMLPYILMGQISLQSLQKLWLDGQNSTLFEIGRDSLYVEKYFNGYEGGKWISYELRDSTLFLFNSKYDRDTLSIFSIDSNKLVFDLGGAAGKRTFKVLKQYNLRVEPETFRTFLTQNQFAYTSDLIEKPIRIDFNDNNHSFLDDLRFYFEGFWWISSYKGELFLILHDHFGTTIHITKINSEGFEGIVYRAEDLNVSYQITKPREGFNAEYLVGKWKAHIPDSITLLPPPVLDMEFYPEERLQISSTEVLRKVWLQRNNFEWKTNKYNNVLILKSERAGESHIWQILKLDRETLIIRRKKKFPVGAQLEVQELETITFYRNKN